jgi:hypothetical protein
MRAERAALVALSLLCSAPAFAAESSTVYCCDDGSGHRICGDPMPQQCYTRAYKELSRGGRTTKEVDAPLTPEERARKDAADKTRRDAEARIAERRRRDRVLLESYTSVGEIDERRDTVVRGAEKEIETLKHREKELVDERNDLNTKVAGLKGKQVPQRIQEDLAANASELGALRGVIAQKQRDADTMRSRFEEDRQRYIELTGKSGGSANN